jgi:hypothetical protein
MRQRPGRIQQGANIVRVVVAEQGRNDGTPLHRAQAALRPTKREFGVPASAFEHQRD